MVKTHWVKIGRAFEGKTNEDRIIIVLDALPIDDLWPSKRLMLFPRDDRRGHYDVSYLKEEVDREGD